MTGQRLLELWSPPDGAGTPVACLATSFTFEADFFTEDCLSRFLSLTTLVGEGDAEASIAAVLEEEDRLSETQVSVLVDRSSAAEKRNLRWDVLPVAAPGGLLHAKVSVLIWERTARVIVGSANLTSAGYRRQVELALAIDLDERCGVPRTVLNGLVEELHLLAQLAPGPLSGAKARAIATVELLAARVEALNLPTRASSDVRMSVAPARPGMTPLDGLDAVWSGARPLRAIVLSPFWDDRVPAPAVEALRTHLTGRPAADRSITLVAAVDPFSGTVEAPASLALQTGADVVAFDPPDTELRTLHAKLIIVESNDWLAALVGSSNATEAGLGLDPRRGHHELNLWIGCPAGSRTARHLRGLARTGEALDLDDERWRAVPDEDEVATALLPLAFVSCSLDATDPASVRVELDRAGLPSWWEIRTPADRLLIDADTWRAAGSPSSSQHSLPDDVLPSYLLVRWDAGNDSPRATWTLNVEDRSALPPPSELADLPVDVLLAALASTRPLPIALEGELRRRQKHPAGSSCLHPNPLLRFDDTGLLLQRTRTVSLALWRLQQRLGAPVTSREALHWRLYGTFGPLSIANGLVRADGERHAVPGEAHFLLAELALTIAAVDWQPASSTVGTGAVQELVSAVLTDLADRYAQLPPAPDPALDQYARDALEAARR